MSESFNCFPLAPENEFGPCVTPSRCTRRCLTGNSFVCSKHTNQCIDFLKYSSSSLKTPHATQYLQSYHHILLLPKCWCQYSFDLRNPECFWSWSIVPDEVLRCPRYSESGSLINKMCSSVSVIE